MPLRAPKPLVSGQAGMAPDLSLRTHARQYQMAVSQDAAASRTVTASLQAGSRNVLARHKGQVHKLLQVHILCCTFCVATSLTSVGFKGTRIGHNVQTRILASLWGGVIEICA